MRKIPLAISEREKLKKLFTRKITGINPTGVVNIDDDNFFKNYSEFEQKKSINFDTSEIVSKMEDLGVMAKEIHYIFEYVERSKNKIFDTSKTKPKSKTKLSDEEKKQLVTAKLLKKSKGLF